ncbi:HAMP domain-containing protein [Jeotgalibacillus terrae]
MLAQARLIATELDELNGSNLTRDQLLQYKEEFSLDGVTIFQETGDDVTATVTSEPGDAGFSLKEAGYYEAAVNILNNDEAYSLVSSETVTGTNISNDERHKYAYYRPEGADYFLNIYVEAEDITAYLNQAGPQALIDEMTENLKVMEEGAVYEMAESGWTFTAGSERTLTEKAQTLIGSDMGSDGDQYYRIYFPVNDSYAAYVALDKSDISAPIYRNALVMMVTRLLPLILLIILISKFFNRVAIHIQKLINQVSALEGGDLTVKNDIDDQGELRKLSVSMNRMTDRLNYLLKKASGYTSQAERMSVMLEKETKETARRMSELTVESAMMARHESEEVTHMLKDAERFVRIYAPPKDADKYLEKISLMRHHVQSKSEAATEITITISDLLHSLHSQAESLAETSQEMTELIDTFKTK